MLEIPLWSSSSTDQCGQWNVKAISSPSYRKAMQDCSPATVEKWGGTVQSMLPDSWFGLFWAVWAHQYWICGLTLLGNLPVSHVRSSGGCPVGGSETWHEEQSSFPKRSQRQNTLCKLSPGSDLTWENNVDQANWVHGKFRMGFLTLRVWGLCFVYLYWHKPWVSTVIPDLYVLKC